MTRLAYILAASHSGSTLLAMLLGGHPDVCTVGELKATSLGDVERYRCSCGTLIRQCPFWQGITADMAARGFEFDITDARTDIRGADDAYISRLLRPLHRGPWLERARDLALHASPAWRPHLANISARNAALAASLAARTGATVVVDSSKIGIRLKYLLRQPDLDVRVIRMIRDGRGVALTYVNPAEFADSREATLRQGGMGGDRATERLSMTDAALEWRRSNEEADAIIAGLDPSRWAEVRYEELCARPLETLQRLCSVLGIDASRATLGFRSRPHHVVGNGMRLDSIERIEFDERWRTALSPADLKIFDEVAGARNRALGYA